MQGHFSKKDAIDLITKLITVKIRFHEDKTPSSHSEEGIKMREKSIKQLQKELYDARIKIESMTDNVNLESEITF
ncbi:MAG: hypothetical protein KKG25_16175 [Bacteroidetes bacterium]|nr:hypothetical protein [Bacteroidota bacterium]MBU1486389.1 hypothetical protein [Bacteroidota bacterium]MBU2268687.1 hypothetical protein [Bacteroidota bacterium]MBU2375383.1 hypothetical protein [Bacteroidota bacterium]